MLLEVYQSPDNGCVVFFLQSKMIDLLYPTGILALVSWQMRDEKMGPRRSVTRLQRAWHETGSVTCCFRDKSFPLNPKPVKIHYMGRIYVRMRESRLRPNPPGTYTCAAGSLQHEVFQSSCRSAIGPAPKCKILGKYITLLVSGPVFFSSKLSAQYSIQTRQVDAK